MTPYEKINKEVFDDPQKIERLKQEARFFLEKSEGHWVEILSERSDKMLSAVSLEQFFRHKERNEHVHRTLHYLLTFLTHIPGPAEIDEAQVNPVEQFREFIRFQVDLLLEADVRKAVFREINNPDSPNDDNVRDFVEHTYGTYRELRERVSQDGGGIAQTIAALCHILERLSLFWLQVRQGDSCRYRRSDLYLFSLSRIVKNRCQQTLDSRA